MALKPPGAAPERAALEGAPACGEHDGLSLFTPADVFFGRVDVVAARRRKALEAAFAQHPQRFVRGLPTVKLAPERVELNPLDPEHKPVTADQILPRDAELASLWTPAPRPSTAPVIHLPGAHVADPGAAPQHLPS